MLGNEFNLLELQMQYRVRIQAKTMSGEKKMKNEKYDEDGIFSTARCRELLLVSGLIVLAIGCGTLYGLMEKNWALDSRTRERVLFVAGFLVVSSIILCYYIIRSQQNKRIDLELGSNTEIVCLLIDKPPSYESISEAPPSYQAVITGAYIIPVHKQYP